MTRILRTGLLMLALMALLSVAVVACSGIAINTFPPDAPPLDAGLDGAADGQARDH